MQHLASSQKQAIGLAHHKCRPLLAVRGGAQEYHSASRATARKQSLPTCKTCASLKDPYIAEKESATAYQEAFYDWKCGTSIKYTRAGTEGQPILLAHGFGVGAYHFERNIPELAENHRVFAVDILGQGGSWPTRELQPGEAPLRYCAETWTEQLHHFIQEYVGEPVYVVGNSLGGFLGANLAANHPDAVKGLILLNAAPFWSFRPPGEDAKGIWKLLQSDGTLPVPEGLKRTIKTLWWDRIRDPASIRSLLQLVYANPAAIDEQLLQRIIAATDQPWALDAFTSIVLSPKTRLTFDEMLEAVQCPVCLAYGREDPWVVPLWGQRLKRRVPQAAYYELSPVGHCPHHEAPAAVNKLIKGWIDCTERGEGIGPLSVGQRWEIQDWDGAAVVVEHVAGKPRTLLEKWDEVTWRLQQQFGQMMQQRKQEQQQQQGAEG